MQPAAGLFGSAEPVTWGRARGPLVCLLSGLRRGNGIKGLASYHKNCASQALIRAAAYLHRFPKLLITGKGFGVSVACRLVLARCPSSHDVDCGNRATEALAVHQLPAYGVNLATDLAITLSVAWQAIVRW